MFEVELPAANAPDSLAVHRRTREMQPLAAAPASLDGVRAVVIDDNEDARELLADLLRAHGYDVHSAPDGLAGLELLRAQRPHLAFVDLGLPGLDGLGVVERLRRESPEVEARLIALTGYGELADRERTTAAGFHAHLVKPATKDAILACVAEQLATVR
jgi:two-component system CheB/CheR fusion protein